MAHDEAAEFKKRIQKLRAREKLNELAQGKKDVSPMSAGKKISEEQRVNRLNRRRMAKQSRARNRKRK